MCALAFVLVGPRSSCTARAHENSPWCAARSMLSSGGLPALHGAALDHACVHVTNLVFLAGRQRVVGKRARARCPHNAKNISRVHADCEWALRSGQSHKATNRWVPPSCVTIALSWLNILTPFSPPPPAPAPARPRPPVPPFRPRDPSIPPPRAPVLQVWTSR